MIINGTTKVLPTAISACGPAAGWCKVVETVAVKAAVEIAAAVVVETVAVAGWITATLHAGTTVVGLHPAESSKI